MDITTYRIKRVVVKEVVHPDFVVKRVIAIDERDNQIEFKMFGEDRTALNFLYDDIKDLSKPIDAKENLLC